MREMTRREFLRYAGTAAGSVAAISFLPGVSFSSETGEASIAASAIRRPSFMAPEIVVSGQDVPFSLTPIGEKATIEKAWLAAPGAQPVPLSIENGLLVPAIPPPPGMYDLFVEVSMGANKRFERQPLAVSVVDSFKTDYVFGAMSDVHFGDPRISSMLSNFSVAGTFKKEIEVFNDNNIQFCISCGDLSFLPPKTRREVMEYADALTDSAKFPTFTVPGNHDGYTSGAGGKINFDNYTHWARSYGALDFSASYGDTAIIGVNTYDAPPELRNIYGGLGEIVDSGSVSNEQLASLDASLAAARASSKLTIAFGHHNPTNTVKDVNGPFEIVPFTETGRGELLSLFEKHSLDYYFAGHVHGIYREKHMNTEIVTVPTAASRPKDGHPIAIYLVKVSDGKITDIETVTIAEL